MPIKGFKHTQTIFIGSVVFVILAIGFISLLGNIQSNRSSGDIRAKAGVAATLKLSGIVSSVDENKGVILVDRVQFLDTQDNQTLGSWTVTPPVSFRMESLGPGTKVVLTVNPTTFLAASHTLTATNITVSR